MPTERPVPAWKRRRFERLGIPLPPDPPKQTQPTPEHAATASDLRAIEEAERDAD